jgi:lipid-binding SYLF domain-containing protein
VGAGAEAKTADVLAFARSKGAYGGISVSGAVIKPRPDWNRIYYGKPVRSIDILVKRSVSKASADALVHSLDTVSGHK